MDLDEIEIFNGYFYILCCSLIDISHLAALKKVAIRGKGMRKGQREEGAK